MKLKCPFCGHESGGYGDKRKKIFSCDLCGARGPKHGKHSWSKIFAAGIAPEVAWARVARIVEKQRLEDEAQLKRMRRLMGPGPVRSLQLRKSVLKVWRRTTPWNWWVENQRGKMLWHSGEDRLIPNLRLFEKAEDSPVRVGDGLPGIARMVIGSEMDKPESSIYRLRLEHCIS